MKNGKANTGKAVEYGEEPGRMLNKEQGIRNEEWKGKYRKGSGIWGRTGRNIE